MTSQKPVSEPRCCPVGHEQYPKYDGTVYCVGCRHYCEKKGATPEPSAPSQVERPDVDAIERLNESHQRPWGTNAADVIAALSSYIRSVEAERDALVDRLNNPDRCSICRRPCKWKSGSPYCDKCEQLAEDISR